MQAIQTGWLFLCHGSLAVVFLFDLIRRYKTFIEWTALG
jgi:hypothetical protein